jgi:hypothetical protein
MLTPSFKVGKISGNFQPVGLCTPTPADFGLDVTVCIAAANHSHNCMVTVSDTMISYGDIIPASDWGTLKQVKLSKFWGVHFAGNDVGAALPVCLNAAGKIRASGDESRETVAALVRASYQEEREQQITDHFLSSLGLSLEKFRNDGFRDLGPAVFGELFNKIKEFDLGIELLIYGGHQRQDIFTIGHPGVVADRSIGGYWSIGSGQYMAMGALAGRALTLMTVPELIYRLCAAKFSAETATGVGKDRWRAGLSFISGREIEANMGS